MAGPWDRDEDEAESNGQDGHENQHDWKQHSGELGQDGDRPLDRLFWNRQWTTGEWHQTGAPEIGSPGYSGPRLGQDGGGVIAPPMADAREPLWPPDKPQPPQQGPPQPHPRQPGAQKYVTPTTMRREAIGVPAGHNTPGYPPQQYLGGPAAAAQQRRQDEERRMYEATTVGRLGHWTGAPLDITRQAMHSARAHYTPEGKLRLHDDGIAFARDQLDEHLITVMHASERESELSFAADLLREVPYGEAEQLRPSGQRESYWYSLIEPYPLRRFLAGCAWIRWFFWADIQAAILDMHPSTFANQAALNPGWHALLATGFWPTGTPKTVNRFPGMGPLWRPETSRYYAYLWRMLCDALAHRVQLEALTAMYLMQDECPPWRSPHHQQAVYRIATDSRHGYGQPPEDAWDHYYGFLAREANVPRVLVETQCRGDITLARPNELLDVTNRLCQEFQDLAWLRLRTANTWSIDASTLALRILEPINCLMPPRRPRTTGY